MTVLSVEVVQIYLSKDQNITSFELNQHYLKVFGVLCSIGLLQIPRLSHPCARAAAGGFF